MLNTGQDFPRYTDRHDCGTNVSLIAAELWIVSWKHFFFRKLNRVDRQSELIICSLFSQPKARNLGAIDLPQFASEWKHVGKSANEGPGRPRGFVWALLCTVDVEPLTSVPVYILAHLWGTVVIFTLYNSLDPEERSLGWQLLHSVICLDKRILLLSPVGNNSSRSLHLEIKLILWFG